MNNSVAINNPYHPYTGFWMRVIAYLIDEAVLNFPFVLIWNLFFLFEIEEMVSFFDEQHPEEFIGYAFGVFESILYLGALWTVVHFVYFAWLESSKWQATFGKLAVGAIVIDENGDRISFGKAGGRYLAKIISGFIFCLGFLMVGWTKRKQGLHDMMASTLVVYSRKLNKTSNDEKISEKSIKSSGEFSRLQNSEEMNGKDLRGMDLKKANLKKANLSSADLRGANLQEADLIEANLIGAKLVSADLRGANLIDAKLIDADLRNANFSGAKLIGTDITGANLEGTIGIDHLQNN